MNYTQSIGNIVELQCLSKFTELGYEVSIPYGNGARYDFVADVNGKFLRIQCKSCTHPIIKNHINKEYDTSAIHISTSSQTTNTKKTTRNNYSKDQIDYFATYYEGKVYLIPVEECSTSKTLRFAPPQNGTNIYNKAEDYEIEKIITPSQNFLNSKEDFEKRMEQRFNERVNNQPEEIKKFYCAKCNKQITRYSKSGLCPECYNIIARKVNRPNREELKDMIRKESFLCIGRRYNVSDNAIRKWCKTMNLPTKKTEIKQYSEEEWSNI